MHWALDYLREVGCDLAQGYFISRPLSISDATIWAHPGTDDDHKKK